MIDPVRKPISSFLALLLTACASVERLAIPAPTLIDEALATSGVDAEPSHLAWDQFLKRYLHVGSDGLGRLAYAQVTEQDREDLERYIRNLSGLDATRWPRDAQLAYWANLYNAQTVSVILEHYPVASIRAIKEGLIDLGPWEDERLKVRGRRLSLHDIEHGIVRPLWPQTPEIHYLLNCAAIGCPTLVAYAYTGDNVQSALQSNARAFINSDRGVSVDERGRLTLSKIYLWYPSDFGGSRSAIIAHLQKYADDATRQTIAKHRNSIRYAYDWALNDHGQKSGENATVPAFSSTESQ